MRWKHTNIINEIQTHQHHPWDENTLTSSMRWNTLTSPMRSKHTNIICEIKTRRHHSEQTWAFLWQCDFPLVHACQNPMNKWPECGSLLKIVYALIRINSLRWGMNTLNYSNIKPFKNVTRGRVKEIKSVEKVTGYHTYWGHSFIHSFIHSFVRSFVRSFQHSIINSLIHSLFIHSLIRTHSCMHSHTHWNHSFKCTSTHTLQRLLTHAPLTLILTHSSSLCPTLSPSIPLFPPSPPDNEKRVTM